MDIDKEMHLQFVKDFILSMQAGSEDSGCIQIESRSLSVSSLNPNAAEFVPSYLKGSDGDDEDDDPSPRRCRAPKAPDSSSTTLVDNETEGDGLHVTSEDAQGRIQRQLFNLMNQLGKMCLPVSEIQFSLTPNGQGINVQFLASEFAKRQNLDEHLCQAAGLCLEIGDGATQSTRPGNAIAAQFLRRMGQVLNDQTKEHLPSICPKCTGVPKKRSYTELEIERQIEDIKAFENLINEDADTRYQEAFKELCHKLGLTNNEEQSLEYHCCQAAAPMAAAPATLPSAEHYGHDEASHEWDSFVTEYAPMKVYKYSASCGTELHVNELLDQQQPQLKQEQQYQDQEQFLRDDIQPDVPPTTPAMSTTTANVSSVYPKLYKVNTDKMSNMQGLRKTKSHKETKIQRWRYNSLAIGGGTAASAGTTTAAATATGATATGTTAVAAKKLTETSHGNENRLTRLCQRAMQPKSGANNMPEVTGTQIAKPSGNCKLAKQQLDHGQVNKLSKAATTSRGGALAQGQGTKNSPAGAQRVLPPRSTHASQMRQSEVKRRLNLMRGDNESDVQFNEYLFK